MKDKKIIKTYSISNLTTYPQDGNHQECFYLSAFEIRKGEDGYFYHDKKGNEKKYNLLKGDKIDDRWIVNIKEEANESLKEIFEIKVHKDLNVILNYCADIYKKSLKMEIKRLQKELKEFDTLWS